jgi:hypothetical protein
MGRAQPLIAEFWLRVLAKVEARHAPGRLKQWLNLLRRNFPQAEALYRELRPRPIRGRSTTSWPATACRSAGGRVELHRCTPIPASPKAPSRVSMNTSPSSSPSTPLRISQTLSRLQQGRLRAQPGRLGRQGAADPRRRLRRRPQHHPAGPGLPDHWVIGVDQSEDRLSRKKPYPDALMPTNLVFVRADLVDYWRLMAEAGIRLARHYILYPNPWPKIGHLARRWHAHPVFPLCRGSAGGWNAAATGTFMWKNSRRAGPADRPAGALRGLRGPVAAHPFERKYRDSGQTLYRCVVELDHLEENPS